MKPILVISAGTCGLARGAEEIIKSARMYQAEHDLKDRFDIKVTGCHGLCEAEPNAVVLYNGRKIYYQKLIPKAIPLIIEESVLKGKVVAEYVIVDRDQQFPDFESIPFYVKQKRLLLGNNLYIDPNKIEDYIVRGGYEALKKTLTDYKPDEIIRDVKASGLRGRGGAGFPVGKKWELTYRAQADRKYIICNADEGDPGAYMDRSLLEGNPHSVLEGMIIGGYAIGAQEGIIYVRNEYPLAVRNIGIALEQVYAHGFLGDNILEKNFSFHIRVIRGAGAFVCGEETALMASIEGRVGRPRPRPPYPAEKGLWGKPTNINNVETWANIPQIINNGPDWFAGIGTSTSTGTKIFSLVGKIKNTGLVEVPMGTSLREIIYDVGGGIANNRKFKAVQTGGPSGGCISKEFLDLPIDYDSLCKVGAIMGSGGMIVMDEDTCMVDVAKYFLTFTQQESCGKCPSCRIGTRQMVEILERITEGRGQDSDLERLEQIGKNIQLASLCGLGQTAPNPVLSVLKYFRSEFEAHIQRNECPAVVCKELTYPPCQYTCPINTEASSYIAHIAHGDYRSAFDVIVKDNPMPGIVGRVCHHPCEAKCRAGQMDKPISIRALKRFIADWAVQNNVTYEPKTAPATGHKVAVVGSGPAGMTVAHYLALKGHHVTIFEAEAKIGGMLRSGIPEYRLPREVLEYDLEQMEVPGIDIRTNTCFGRDIDFDGLNREKYEAVFIGVGAYKSMKLGIDGEDASGVYAALEFLRSYHRGTPISIGRRVVVIGGGNAAVDAARVAHRLGSKVTIIYRRTKQEMPAFVEEVEHALQEGVEIVFLAAPNRIVCAGDRITGIEFNRMRLGAVDDSGRRRPVPIPDSTFIIDTDTLLVAISEQPETSMLRGLVELTKWGTIETRADLMTSRQGVFAGGDAIRGPSTVIEAIRDGKNAAESIDCYMQGKTWKKEYPLCRPTVYVRPLFLGSGELSELKVITAPTLDPAQREGNFKEVETGYDETQARSESRRCLRCEFETKDGQKVFARFKNEIGEKVEQ